MNKQKILERVAMLVTLLLVLSLLLSCDITKQATKNKVDREVTEQTETITKRKGDTVSFEVPRITFKDTTIYTTNRQGTTLRTVYNDSGQISQIDCFASMIEEINRSNKQLIETLKEKEKEKTEDFDSTFILYLFVGLSLIVFILAFFAYRLLNKNTKTINRILDTL